MKFDEVKKVVQLDYTEEFEIDDLNSRRLFINGDIDEDILDSIVYHILRYNREDKGIEVEKRQPILLYINTRGGSVPDGYGLIDVMLASKTPIYTINQAMCASMGFLIFLAGSRRYSMKSAEFLMHDGNTMGWDSTAKMKDRMEFETGQIEKMTKDYIMSRTTIGSDLYDQKYRVEWYMLPEEAKSHQICTSIVGVDCELDEII